MKSRNKIVIGLAVIVSVGLGIRQQMHRAASSEEKRAVADRTANEGTRDIARTNPTVKIPEPKRGESVESNKRPGRTVASIAPADLEGDTSKRRLGESEKLLVIMGELGTKKLMENLEDMYPEEDADDQTQINAFVMRRNLTADTNVLAVGSANELELSRTMDGFVGSTGPDGCTAWVGQCPRHPEYTGQKFQVPEVKSAAACMAHVEHYTSYCDGATVNLSFYSGSRLVDSVTTVANHWGSEKISED